MDTSAKNPPCAELPASEALRAWQHKTNVTQYGLAWRTWQAASRYAFEQIREMLGEDLRGQVAMSVLSIRLGSLETKLLGPRTPEDA
jgi:hypothetical protein